MQSDSSNGAAVSAGLPQPIEAISGLPVLSAGDSALLTSAGEVVIASGRCLSAYRLDANAEAPHARPTWRADLAAPITHLCNAEGAVLAVTGNQLVRVTGESTRTVIEFNGTIRSIASARETAFVAVQRAGRLDGVLFEVDLARGAIASEQRIASPAVRLSVDASGRHLGIADGASFRMLAIGVADPCPPAPAEPRDRSEPSNPNRHDKPNDPCGCNPPASGPHAEHPPASDPPRRDPCDPGTSGLPTPDGGRVVGDGSGVTHHPPGGTSSSPGRPAGPCRTNLFFEVAQLYSIGAHYLAADREGRHLALLAAADLAIVEERSLRRGAVIVAHPAAPMMLLYNRGAATWERMTFARIRPSALDSAPIFAGPALLGEPMTFVGQPMNVMRGGRAPKTGNLRVLVLPMVEPGQAFNDPDLAKFSAYMQRVAFPQVREFFRENSFGLMKDVTFDMFGVTHFSGGPLRLPRPIAAAYNPEYIGAHVDLVKSGITAASPIVFDGRERLTLTIAPQTGGRAPATLTLKFFAAIFSKSLGNFPAQIRFAGTETATLSVRRPNGASATLNLAFPAKTIDIANDGDVAAKLTQLADYLDGVIAAAESAAGITTRLFAKPSIRRLRQPEPGFGFLITTLTHAADTGNRLELTGASAAGVNPLGIDSNLLGRFTANPGSVSGLLRDYLDFVATLAQEDAGFDYTQRRLADEPVVQAAGGTLKTSFFIVPEDGGPGATLTASAPIELGALFDTISSVPNTPVTAGRSNTPRDGAEGFDGLVDEALTAAVERMAPPGQHAGRKDAINAFFQGYNAILVGLIEPPKTDPADPEFPQPNEMWSCGPNSRTAGMRAVEGPRTARYKPFTDIQCANNWSFAFFDVKPDYPVMCHELGHAIDLGDLYQREAGYRDDLIYIEDWSVMHKHPSLSHHCGYHKWQAGWITDDRVHVIPPAQPGATLSRDVLLVPVEYWHDNNALVQRSRDVFGDSTLPVAQLIQLDIGGDADVFNLIEARQAGPKFSKKLPAAPALLVTNCVIWWDENRYAFNNKYRAPVHPLHAPNALRNVGDRFDLAKAAELPEKGIVVSIVDRKTVDGVEVTRVRIERKNAEFIDLYFSSAEPYYKNPDLWVDWTGDNGPGGTSSTDPARHRRYPNGQPTDQGEKVFTPNAGEELHWLVARLRNRGGVKAESVKLNYSICEPSGGGDRGNFKVIDTVTLPEVLPTPGDQSTTIPGKWRVPANLQRHNCLMVEVADWKIPRDSDGAALASNDSWEKNNRAQKNVDVVEPKSSSPYAPIEFDFSVNNSARWPEVAYLEPDGLPHGMRLTVTPRRRKIAAGETAIFRCALELDDTIIDASCRGDNDFRIIVWRVEDESAMRWGGVHYKVRPRKRTSARLAGTWDGADKVVLNGQVSPDPGTGSVRIRLAYVGRDARWVSTPLQPGGLFAFSETAPRDSRVLVAVALFEGNKQWSESRSPDCTVTPPPPLR